MKYKSIQFYQKNEKKKKKIGVYFSSYASKSFILNAKIAAITNIAP